MRYFEGIRIRTPAPTHNAVWVLPCLLFVVFRFGFIRIRSVSVALKRSKSSAHFPKAKGGCCGVGGTGGTGGGGLLLSIE